MKIWLCEELFVPTDNQTAWGGEKEEKWVLSTGAGKALREKRRGWGDVAFPQLAWGTAIKTQLKSGLGAKEAISMNN